MAVPSSQYTFEYTGRTLKFKDTSTNAPTSWLWDFGDTQTSTDQNPEHTFAEDKIYTVKLTASNGEGAGNVISKDIVVTLALGIPQTIKDLVKANLPTSITFSESDYDQYLRKWMLYLYKGAGVAEADVFNEVKWPALYRLLLSYLVIYSMNAKVTGISITATTNSQKGAVKRIEAGPSVAEWYNPADASKVVTEYTEVAVSEVCILAAQLGVQLPMCPLLKGRPLFTIAYPNY